jgi:hypothetical protein
VLIARVLVRGLVDAVFHYVRENLTHRPVDLLDKRSSRPDPVHPGDLGRDRPGVWL